MILSASQIVGLIEIETPGGAGSESLVPMGCEERSLAELLVWLARPMATPTIADDSAARPTNRFAGLLAADPAPLLAADLDQLESDLVAAAAQLRLRLSAASASE